jgi:PAS domain S-box-containing protein
MGTQGIDMATDERGPAAETVSVFETAGAGTPLTTNEVASRLDLGRRATYDRLDRLVDESIIETKKVGAKGRVWWLPPGTEVRVDPSPEAAASGNDTEGTPGSMLDRLIGNVPGMVYRCGNELGWPMRFVSRGSEALCGYDPGRIERGDVSWGEDVIHPDDRQAVRAEVEEGLAADGRFTLQYRIRTADEAVRWVWERGCAVGEDADVLEGIITDITDQKLTEEELAAETAFVDSLLDAQPDIVYALAADGSMRRWNDRLPAVTGYDDSEIAEMSATDFFSGAARSRAVEEIAAVMDGGEVRTVELPLETAGGDRTPYEFTGAPITDDQGEIIGQTGIGRDVSDRKARERRLRAERDELERELDEVFGRIDAAFYAVDADFRFTYVNDQAESLLGTDAESLIGRVCWDEFPEATETEVWDAFHDALAAQEPRSIEMFYDPLEFWVAADVYPSETGLSVYFRDVTERKERERALAEQRKRLAALNDVHGIVRDINEALVEQSSREKIEQMVCERLADTESYRFAWIGAPDQEKNELVPRAEAGVNGYVEEISISLDAEDPTARGPGGRAIQLEEIQVTQDALTEPDFEPWRELAREYGYRSAAAIPIVHEETLYGLLAVYAERPEAFAAEERRVISQLGETIGHAIAAVERKQALTSEQVVELELRVEGFLAGMEPDLPPGERVVLENFVPIGDDRYVAYGTASEPGFEAVQDLVDGLEQLGEVERRATDGDRVGYDLRLEDPPILSAVVNRGGVFDRAILDDGDAVVQVRLPPQADVRQLVETLEERTPGVDLVTRRQRARDPTTVAVEHTLTAELTDRQRAALEVGYRAGYFEWPREQSGQEVAEALGISEPTFQQHLRKAQAELLGSWLD